MSVWVYKDGESELVDPSRLAARLESGWSVDDVQEKASSKKTSKKKASKKKG